MGPRGGGPGSSGCAAASPFQSIGTVPASAQARPEPTPDAHAHILHEIRASLAVIAAAVSPAVAFAGFAQRQLPRQIAPPVQDPEPPIPFQHQSHGGTPQPLQLVFNVNAPPMRRAGGRPRVRYEDDYDADPQLDVFALIRGAFRQQ